ncbi:MAG: TonB-dependent receptor plug domain-containing protein, partial [Odoribacter sp.]
MKNNRSGFCILQNYLKIPFLVICILALTLSLYANTIAQAKVNLNFKNVTFKDLFLEIQKQTKLSFVFNADQLNTIGRVEIKVENESVNVVLDRILGSTPYTYSMEGQTIVIIPRQKQSPQGQQQYRSVTIKGKVTDSDGIPLVGATVRIYGTTIGTAADEKGEYKIVVGENQNELMVSYIGYINQVVKVDGKTVLNFVMREDQRAIEEVVVTGYQNIKRERMTGSSTTINATELRNKGLTSMDEYLNGTISGLTSISSGRPGEDAKIMIRGVNSLTGSTDPIWIVDGMPLQGEIPNIAVGTTNLQSTIFTSGIGNIAPDDIESITVLKDAAATAIYGARAANGVIVIKTKTGLAGKTRFNITANYGITER